MKSIRKEIRGTLWGYFRLNIWGRLEPKMARSLGSNPYQDLHSGLWQKFWMFGWGSFKEGIKRFLRRHYEEY